LIFDDLIKPPAGKLYCAFLSQNLAKSFLDYVESKLLVEDEEEEVTIHPLFSKLVSAMHHILLHHRKDLHGRAPHLLGFMSNCIKHCWRSGDKANIESLFDALNCLVRTHAMDLIEDIRAEAEDLNSTAVQLWSRPNLRSSLSGWVNVQLETAHLHDLLYHPPPHLSKLLTVALEDLCSSRNERSAAGSFSSDDRPIVAATLFMGMVRAVKAGCLKAEGQDAATMSMASPMEGLSRKKSRLGPSIAEGEGLQRAMLQLEASLENDDTSRVQQSFSDIYRRLEIEDLPSLVTTLLLQAEFNAAFIALSLGAVLAAGTGLPQREPLIAGMIRELLRMPEHRKHLPTQVPYRVFSTLAPKLVEGIYLSASKPASSFNLTSSK